MATTATCTTTAARTVTAPSTAMELRTFVSALASALWALPLLVFVVARVRVRVVSSLACPRARFDVAVLVTVFTPFVLPPASAQVDPPSSFSELPADAGSPSPRSPIHAAPPVPVRPTAREVIRMALDAARGLGPERLRALSRRARLAGLMPQLKLSAERGLQQDLSSSTTALSDRVNAAVGDDLRLGATLTFDLDRLVFAPEEVRLLSVERWLETDRRKLINDVVKLYFQRRRLLREQASASQPDPELADAIAEIEALLDEFTDGKFGKAVARGRVAR